MNHPDCTLVTRRRFITGLGATVLLASCGARGISMWGPAPSTTSTAASSPPAGLLSPAPGRTLVVIEMGGGNDALNMGVPHSDPRYFDLRRNLGIEDPLDLDGEVGLHPEMSWLAEQYRAGQLAVVEGVGVPDPDLSHFVSMGTWWTGRPGSSDTTGWLGRYLDATVGFEQPLAGVSIGPGPSRALLGAGSYPVAIQDETGLAPQVPPWVDDVSELMGAWEGFAPAGQSDGRLQPIARAIESAVAASAQLEKALQPVPGATPRLRGRTLAADLDLAARLVSSPTPPAVIYLHGFGDFDTHQGQLARQSALLADGDSGLSGFLATLAQQGVEERVVVATVSEFGRRPRDNGSGTDHGTAAAQLVVGPRVKGGRYGEPLNLNRLDPAGNPTLTVDYRSLYATLLQGWLQADAEMLLDGAWETLPLL